VLDEVQRERARALIVLTRVPARARLTNEVLAELSRLQSPIAATRLGNRTAYAATLAVGASVADWSMQDEPWCIDAAREIGALSEEVLDFVAGHYGETAARALVGA
jgi:chromosome partitioning protein